MFGKKEKRAWELFKILFEKFDINPSTIKEKEVIYIYKKATDVVNSIENLEDIYRINGKIDINKLGDL